MRFLSSIAAYLKRRATFQRIYSELDGFSDRQLTDIGITRADIGRIALDAANATMTVHTLGTVGKGFSRAAAE